MKWGGSVDHRSRSSFKSSASRYSGWKWIWPIETICWIKKSIFMKFRRWLQWHWMHLMHWWLYDDMILTESMCTYLNTNFQKCSFRSKHILSVYLKLSYFELTIYIYTYFNGYISQYNHFQPYYKWIRSKFPTYHQIMKNHVKNIGEINYPQKTKQQLLLIGQVNLHWNLRWILYITLCNKQEAIPNNWRKLIVF